MMIEYEHQIIKQILKSSADAVLIFIRSWKIDMPCPRCTRVCSFCVTEGFSYDQNQMQRFHTQRLDPTYTH